MQGLLNLFDIYGERFLVAGVSLLSLTFVTLMFLWSYNRRKFMAYKHHIPARVMQGYLDSIIQNSSALKSSLLRGGGSDSVPFNPAFLGESALLRGNSNNNSNDNSDDDSEQPSNAQIAEIKNQITEKDAIISDLEEKMTEMLTKLRDAEERASNNQPAAAPAPAASGNDEAMKLQLSELAQERDLLKEKLKEYEFIENDLAEIPRLQRTVETLKATVKQLGVDPDEAMTGKVAAAPAAKTAAPTPEAAAPAPTPAAATPAPSAEKVAAPAPTPAATPAAATTAAPAAAATEDKPAGEKKGDDDLLQQFEKMLG